MAFTIPPQHRKVLDEIISSGKMPRIEQELSSREDLSDREGVSAAISKTVGLPSDLIRRFLGILGSIVLTRISTDTDASSFTTELISQLKSHKSKAIDNLSDHDLQAAKTSIEKMSTLSTVEGLAKTSVLLRQNERTFRKASITPTLKPAFSESGEFLAFALIYELKISFESAGVKNDLFFGLDGSEMLDLKATIDSALRNAKALDVIMTTMPTNSEDTHE
jgi:hypothetical protein